MNLLLKADVTFLFPSFYLFFHLKSFDYRISFQPISRALLNNRSFCPQRITSVVEVAESLSFQLFLRTNFASTSHFGNTNIKQRKR